jgi:hypothetical protein
VKVYVISLQERNFMDEDVEATVDFVASLLVMAEFLFLKGARSVNSSIHWRGGFLKMRYGVISQREMVLYSTASEFMKECERRILLTTLALLTKTTIR